MRKLIFCGILLFGSLISINSLSAQVKLTVEPQDLKWMDYPQSMQEMLAQFKGKVVYMDVMASWCKPCREELKEYAKLDEFFEKNDIVKIFISIDDSTDWQACYDMLKSNNVKGYFITSPAPASAKGSSFPQDSEKLFVTFDAKTNAMNMSIPRYSIVNREGVIVNNRAKRPSQTDELIKQLEEYL